MRLCETRCEISFHLHNIRCTNFASNLSKKKKKILSASESHNWKLAPLTSRTINLIYQKNHFRLKLCTIHEQKTAAFQRTHSTTYRHGVFSKRACKYANFIEHDYRYLKQLLLLLVTIVFFYWNYLYVWYNYDGLSSRDRLGSKTRVRS